jgi:hypothetical protein
VSVSATTYRPGSISREGGAPDDGFTLKPKSWRPKWTPDPNRPVRCVDGFARPINRCVQLSNGGWKAA